MAAISLTPAEQRVLDLVERCKRQKDAAHALGLSPRTVEVHLLNIRRRLGVSKTRDAIALWRGKESA